MDNLIFLQGKSLLDMNFFDMFTFYTRNKYINLVKKPIILHLIIRLINQIIKCDTKLY